MHRLTETAMDEMAAIAGGELVRRTGSAWLAGDDEADGLQAAVAAMQAAGIACRLDPAALPERMRPWYEIAAVVEADGMLLPARWVRRLAEAAVAAGADVYERSEVTAVDARRAGLGGHARRGERTSRPARSWSPATASSLALIPALAGVVYPVRGQVVATEPLADTVIALPTHSDHGFFYYRPTDDGRVTLGGGRHADVEAEYTTQEAISDRIQAAIEGFLSERLGIPAERIEHRWAGIMGFSADMLPVVGELPGSPGLWVCGGYSGVGNVPGFALGQLVADRIAGGAGDPREPSARRGPLRCIKGAWHLLCITRWR